MTGFGGFMIHAVDVVRPSTSVNRYGDTVADWTAGTRTTVKGWLARRTTTELTDGREALVSEWELTLPLATDILAGDRVEQGGHRFRVMGDVDEAPTPLGHHHLVVRLQTVEG